MLQFTTAYTYYIQADLRTSLQARPYSLHAIYSHGHDDNRKRAVLREAHGWHDPPSYYDDPRRTYLTYNAKLPERATRHGGFDIVLTQLRRFELALRLAMLANRTLVMPRLRCGNAAMAYPCYAWYHRASTSAGFRHDRVPMPEYCPSYYWLDHGHAQSFPLRESSFLTNPRVPQSVLTSRAELHIKDATAAAAAPSPAAKHANADASLPPPTLPAVTVAPHATLAKLDHAFRKLLSARVVHLTDLSRLSMSAADERSLPPLPSRKFTLGGGLNDISPLSSGFWCTACVVTRRGGVLHETNRSTHRELERFCRTEARGALRLPGARQTCCNRRAPGEKHSPPNGYPAGCPICEDGEHRTWNESALSWHMRQWLPLWAHQLGSAAEQVGWKCLHPLCTSSDPKKFP